MASDISSHTLGALNVDTITLDDQFASAYKRLSHLERFVSNHPRSLQDESKMLVFYVLAAFHAVYAEPIWSRAPPKIHQSLTNANLDIAGGSTVSIVDYPYMVLVEHDSGAICSGSILTRHFVLTSASCAYLAVRFAHVRSGSNTKGAFGSIHPIIETILHEDYKPGTLENDIGLIRVSEAFDFNTNSRQPILLAGAGEKIPQGQFGTVSGWGWTDSLSPEYAQQLQAVSLPMYEAKFCLKEEDRNRNPGLFCGGFPEPLGRGVCYGDFGSPLVSRGKLIGIAILPYFCGRESYDLFYSISYYRNWIDQHVNE